MTAGATPQTKTVGMTENQHGSILHLAGVSIHNRECKTTRKTAKLRGETVDERARLWHDVFRNALPEGVAIPQWRSTHRRTALLREPYSDLSATVFEFSQPTPIGEYLRKAEAVEQHLSDTAGIVLEGANPHPKTDNKLEIVAYGACQFLIAYHTSDASLGNVNFAPHLKRWGTEPGEKASPEAMFALRLVLGRVGRAMPLFHRFGNGGSLCVLSAVQHNTEPTTPDNEAPVTWEVRCQYRYNNFSHHEKDEQFFFQRLCEILKCDWTHAEDDTEEGVLVLWLSNTLADKHLATGEPQPAEPEPAQPG